MGVTKKLLNLSRLRTSSALLHNMVATSCMQFLCYRTRTTSQKKTLDSAHLALAWAESTSFRGTDMMNWLLSCFLVLTRTSYHLRSYKAILKHETISFIILSQLGLPSMKNVIDNGEQASCWEIWKPGRTPATPFKGFLFTSATKALWKMLVFYY